MDLLQLDAHEVIQEHAVDLYKQAMTSFHAELMVLNVNLMHAEYILNFPFDVFGMTEQTIFFRMSAVNALRSAILTITKLVVDQGDPYTLLKLKNDIQNTWIKDEYKPELRQLLRQAKFDKEVERILKQIREFRHSRLAHLDRDYIFAPTKEFNLGAIGVNMEDLKQVAGAIDRLFQTLSFGVDRIMLPLGYSPRISGNSKIDIEELLDNIARNSSLINMPERDGEWWPSARAQLSQRKLHYLNVYRRKFGLPEA